MQDICDLHAVGLDDLALVGGKAIGLGRMIQGNLPVPAGFCVTTSAFRSSQQTGLADGLTSQIVTAYKGLGGGKAAVRSSATSEDGAITSFAGQQETMLGIEGDQAICDAVIRCWKSLFTERALAYRGRLGISNVGVAMAVIIQQMVPAEVAGVVFTRDPINPSANEMLVEASWGLGEAVVSGDVTPDRWYLERDNGAVCNRQIAVKSHEMTIDGMRLVDSGRMQRPCLDDDHLRTLAELAKRVEVLFGVPCDIEWALSEGRFWLLQARPITVLEELDREQVRAEEIAALAAKAEPGGTVWSRFNLSEVMPTPTPMTWSIVGRLLSTKGGFGLVYRDLGFDPDTALDESGAFDLVCGRPYCNLSREPRMYYRSLPFEHPFATLKADPSKAHYPQPVLNPARLDWKFWIQLPVTFPLLVARMLIADRSRRKLANTFERHFLEDIVPPFIREVKATLAEDLTGLSTAELWERCKTWQQRTLVDFARESLKPTALAQLALGHLEQRLTPSLGRERAGQAARELIMNVPPRKGADLAQALCDVTAGRLPEGSFLKDFGHRGCNEMEMSEPRWVERTAVGGRLLEEFQGTPIGFTRTQGAELVEEAWARIAAEAKLSPSAAERIRKEVFALRSWVSLRETAKHYFMQGYAVIRHFLCELDKRFQLDGGIFFLTAVEIPRLLQGEELQSLIAIRVQRRRLMLQLQVPSVLFSDDLDAIGRQSPVVGASTLQGTPLSAGVAEGPALVLDQPIGKPVPGPYVLVCPSTDPAWVPLFAGATALVMETGGVLSHGAIVAREFGLPAVAGIPGIQRMIKSGQSIRVDGKNGLVVLLKDEANFQSCREGQSELT